MSGSARTHTQDSQAAKSTLLQASKSPGGLEDKIGSYGTRWLRRYRWWEELMQRGRERPRGQGAWGWGLDPQLLRRAGTVQELRLP